MPRRMSFAHIFGLAVLTLALVHSGPLAAATPDDAEPGSTPLLRVLDAAKQGASGNQRLVGGHPVRFTDNPWQVAVVAANISSNAKAQFCGGAIISARWVVTAAHCVDGGTLPGQIQILSGTDSLLSGGTRTAVAPNGIFVHDKWNPKTHDFDIALVHVVASLVGELIGATSAIEPEPPGGLNVIVTGWGALDWNGAAGTTTLQGVSFHT